MIPTLALAAVLFQSPAEPPRSEAPRFQPTLAPDATIQLTAAWEPCRRSMYDVFAENEVLRSLKPFEERHTYGAAEVAPFLPKQPVALGETWEVPREAVEPFLAQLHPGVMTTLRHYGTYPGTHALLRAASDEAFEILFRSHAEFQVEERHFFSPAQFEGRLVLERPSGRPLALRIALPSRDTNVDVNVPLGDDPERFEADIGWVPRMEVFGGDLRERAWTSSVPDADARLTLARRFYLFAEIDWLPFDRAVQLAREEKKPLHVVVLFGTLDDESC